MTIIRFDLAGAPRVSIEDARRSFDRATNIVFLDVRSEAAFEKAHIPGAISMPLREIPKRLGELSPDMEIITY